MTPAQQQALEGVAGRALTAEDIAVLDPLLAWDNRQDVSIAAHLSIGRTRPVRVPIPGLQAYMQSHGIWWSLKAAAADPAHPGQQAAAAILEVASARYDNVDIERSFVGYVFTALVAAGLMSADDLATIQAMGRSADPLHYNTVSDALNRAEGRVTLEG